MSRTVSNFSRMIATVLPRLATRRPRLNHRRITSKLQTGFPRLIRRLLLNRGLVKILRWVLRRLGLFLNRFSHVLENDITLRRDGSTVTIRHRYSSLGLD